VRDRALAEAQQIAMDHFEKLFDRLYGDDSGSSAPPITRDSHVVYLHVGSNRQQQTEDVVHRLRAWLRGLSLVSRVQTADSRQGGDAYLAVELAFESLH
jgi:hypothetical protein